VQDIRELKYTLVHFLQVLATVTLTFELFELKIGMSVILFLRYVRANFNFSAPFNFRLGWLGDVAVACWTSDLDVAGLTPGGFTARYQPWEVVHTRVSAHQAVKGSDALWLEKSNHMFGVALAMRHGLSGLSTYELNGHRKGDEH